MLTGMKDWRSRCPECEDVIGVYEPIVVLEAGTFRHSSLLNEPNLDSEQVLMHRDCAHSLPSPPPER
jgi:hypothetical protein